MKRRALLASLGQILVLWAGACSSSTNPSGSTTPAALHSATTLTDFVRQLEADYNYQVFPAATGLKNSDLKFDLGFEAFPGSVSIFGSDPVNGTFDSVPVSTAPAVTARLSFGPKDSHRKTLFAAFDATTGVQAEGQYQAFWGIDYAGSSPTDKAVIVILAEGIVTKGGAAKYRVLHRFFGEMQVGPTTLASVMALASGQIGMTGQYRVVNVQTIDHNDPNVPCSGDPCAVEFYDLFVKQ